jgi:hypothetical protein
VDTIFQFKETQLADLLEKATAAGAQKVLTELGLKKNQLSQRETLKRYGYSRVKRWRLEGKIKPIKNGRTIFYNLDDLERLQNVNDFYTKDWDKN